MPRGVKRPERPKTLMTVRFTFKDSAPKKFERVTNVIAGGRFVRLVTDEIIGDRYPQIVEVSMEDSTGYTIVLKEDF